jgi:hypothetical protein
VIVPSSLKHQKFDKNPNIIKSIYEQLKTAPVEVLNKLQKCGYVLDLSPVISSAESDTPSNPSGTPPEPLPNPSGTPPLYLDSDSDIDIDSDSDKNINLPEKSGNSNCETSEKVFLRIWQRNMDIFNFAARIEKPKEWAAFWEKCPYPPDDIKRRMQNFIDGVKNGSIEKLYVPRTPDRFVLKGHLNTSDSPYRKNGKQGGVSPPSLKDKKSLGGLDA